MRYFATILFLLTSAGTVVGGDYLRLGVDSLRISAASAEIPFFWERTCPDPAGICGTSNGFVFGATGDVTWEFLNCYIDPSAHGFFMLGVLQTRAFDNVFPETLLVGGSGWSPSCMPVFDDRLFFTIYTNIGGGEGEIWVDSAYTFIAGIWKWWDLACGLGGAPDRPLFVDKYGSDENHPIRITVYGPPCGDLNTDWSVDIDDIVFLANYIFGGGPAPVYFEDSDVDCSGQIDIDDVVYLMDYVFGTGLEPCAGCP